MHLLRDFAGLDALVNIFPMTRRILRFRHLLEQNN